MPKQKTKKTNTPKPNRQAQRKEKTKALLTQATRELLLEKGFDTLTVHDIIEHADVARGTFYVYFESKEAAVWSLLEAILLPIDQYLLDNPALDDASRTKKWGYIFQEIASNQEILLALLGEKGHISVLRQMEAYVCDLMKRDLKAGYLVLRDNLDVDFVANYLAGALMRVIVGWLEQPDKPPISEIAQLFFMMARQQFENDI